ncbi:MAG: YaaA family protein [Candidatus Izemoplasmataceae bacterium]
MKILISPSKTMKKVNEPSLNHHIFENEKQLLYNHLKTLSLNSIKKTFGISDKLSKEVESYYKTFKEDSPAILTYTGAQFKALNYKQLDDNSKDYLDKHLLIMSGLYGLLKPKDAVAYYRLPMGVSLNKQSMEFFWKNPINNYLKEEDFIINLASDEYGDLLNHPKTISIVFYQSLAPLKRAASMEVKKLRGIFLRFLATKNIKQLDELKRFCAEGYKVNESFSNALTIVFIKS